MQHLASEGVAAVKAPHRGSATAAPRRDPGLAPGQMWAPYLLSWAPGSGALFLGILRVCWSSGRASQRPGQRGFCPELCQINACPGFNSSPTPPPRVLTRVSACELVWRLSAGRGRVIAFANFRAQSPLGIDSQYLFRASLSLVGDHLWWATSGKPN